MLLAEKPGKAGVESLGVRLVTWMRQMPIFFNRCLNSWTLVDSPSAFHWRMGRADWQVRFAGSAGTIANLLVRESMVCNGPCRSCGGVVVQSLQIQLFLAMAVVAASLVRPEQERWN